MKALCIAVVCALVLAGSSHTQEKAPVPAVEEMMKRLQEASTPGDPHKRMGEMAGRWKAHMKVWMNGPGTEATVSQGTAEFTMILDGRFLQQEMSGEMMGMPMTGVGLYGYDNFKKKYTTFWADNTGTAMFYGEGVMEKDGKTITYWGKMDDPASGERDKKVKYVLTKHDESNYAFRIFDVKTYGEKDPVMEILYTRNSD